MNLPMIFSLLALFLSALACACTIWHIRENSREHRGMILYSDTAADCAASKAMKHVNTRTGEIMGLFDAQKVNLEKIDQKFTEETEYLNKKIDFIASDITPNFEAAKAAMARVTDMSIGLSNLFNYDPAEVLRNSRNEGRGEAE